MGIYYSVWSIKPGKKGFAKRYPPSSYAAAEVLKCSLMNAHQNDNVFLFIMKERFANASVGSTGRSNARNNGHNLAPV